jgi:glucose-1-phosphate cytidylyltransferase
VEKYIPDDTFLLTYGDGVANIDLRKLTDFHAAHGKIGTVTGVRTPSRYGELSVLSGRVNSFSEKPQAQDGFISGGFFVFHRRFFDYLADDDACVMERHPLENLTKEGQLMSYSHTGYWHCMDTYRDFVALNDLWKQSPPWKVWQ